MKKIIYNLDGEIIWTYEKYLQDRERLKNNPDNFPSGPYEDRYLRNADFRKENLEGQDFNGSDLSGSSFEGADLYAFSAIGARLFNCNFSYADLRTAIIEECEVSYSIFWGSQLGESRPIGEKEVVLWTFSDSNFSFANFTRANLSSCDFNKSKFNHAILAHCRLWYSDFSEADLTGANFQGAFYNEKTKFPGGFDPVKEGLIFCSPKERGGE